MINNYVNTDRKENISFIQDLLCICMIIYLSLLINALPTSTDVTHSIDLFAHLYFSLGCVRVCVYNAELLRCVGKTAPSKASSTERDVSLSAIALLSSSSPRTLSYASQLGPWHPRKGKTCIYLCIYLFQGHQYQSVILVCYWNMPCI